MLLSLSPFTFFIYRSLPPVFFSLSPLSNSPFISIIEGQRPSMPAAYATESIPLIYCRHENFENAIIYDDLFSWYFEVCVPRKKLVNSFSLWTRSHHLLIVTSSFLLRYVIIMPWVRVIIISKRFIKFTWRIFTNGKIFLVPIQNFFPPSRFSAYRAISMPYAHAPNRVKAFGPFLRWWREWYILYRYENKEVN